MIYPTILTDIRDVIVTAQLNMTGDNGVDGRLNSALDEQRVVDFLSSKFPGKVIGAPRPRFWYDFAVYHDSVFYPVNIKITNGYNKDTADNAGQMVGLLWSLTDVPEATLLTIGNKPRTNTKVVNDMLVDGKGDAKRDYYYLVINKADNSQCMISSMRTMTVSMANSGKRNIPFQANWLGCQSPVDRTFDEAYKYLIGAYQHNLQLMQSDYSRIISRTL